MARCGEAKLEDDWHYRTYHRCDAWVAIYIRLYTRWKAAAAAKSMGVLLAQSVSNNFRYFLTWSRLIDSTSWCLYRTQTIRSYLLLLLSSWTLFRRCPAYSKEGPFLYIRENQFRFTATKRDRHWIHRNSSKIALELIYILQKFSPEKFELIYQPLCTHQIVREFELNVPLRFWKALIQKKIQLSKRFETVACVEERKTALNEHKSVAESVRENMASIGPLENCSKLGICLLPKRSSERCVVAVHPANAQKALSSSLPLSAFRVRSPAGECRILEAVRRICLDRALSDQRTQITRRALYARTESTLPTL